MIQPEGRGEVAEPKTNCFKEQAVSKLMGVSLMPFIASDCLKRDEKAFEVSLSKLRHYILAFFKKVLSWM